ncbi:universal stress protein [Halobacteria archaeon AArc-dxtr1]|nr:universal stress protein [Halobacteria archaeon AArc-dxtr1]
MNVLLGIEGSDESEKTLRRTIDRTLEAGDDLTVAIIDKESDDRSVEETREHAKALLADAGIDAAVETLDGDPGSALVEYAERGEFDQLVLGGGTISPMGKIRLGPITEFVLLNTTTTVTLVR